MDREAQGPTPSRVVVNEALASLPLGVGLVPLIVGVAFLPPSGLAVMLGCLRVVKHLRGVGRFALGAGGPLVRSGGALMRPPPTLDLLVMLVLVVAGHRMSLPAARPLTMFFETARDVRVILFSAPTGGAQPDRGSETGLGCARRCCPSEVRSRRRLRSGEMDRSGRSSGVADTGASFRRLVADSAHGPLPALMLVLTVLTGVVDAVSILSLGRVFVANMTGNVVFLGFALAGASGFSLAASLSALGGFLLGAAIGGAAVGRLGSHRGRLVAAVSGGELVLVLVALVAAAAAGPSPGGGAREGIAALVALAMGAQNAVVRQLKVFDLTTTVLTMTLTGIAADMRQRDRFAIVRRLLAVGAMLAGAAVGAVLVLEVSDVAALGLAAALLAIVVVCATAGSRSPAQWHAPRP
jgi:uncharacterized membrane protein YoaK (UPF0700 family)